MRVPKKCRYALRAVYELAAQAEKNGDLLSARKIAAAQAIPHKFLEAILADLRQAGLVQAQRGKVGGYRLSRPASRITVGDVIRAVHGEIGPAPDASDDGAPADRALRSLWSRVRAAMVGVYDNTTIADLLRRPPVGDKEDYVLHFAI